MKSKKGKSKKNNVIDAEPKRKTEKSDNKTSKVPKKSSKNSKRDSREPSISSSRSHRSFSSRGSSLSKSIGESEKSDEDSDYSDSLSENESDSSDQQSHHSDVRDPKRNKSKSKKTLEPIVTTCCGFCSLGAGSLLTAIIYIGFGIGFMLYRVADFKIQAGKNNVIYEGGTNIYKDIWRLLLIGGMLSACISMLGALILLIASCLFGQKEHFSKMRAAVITWSCFTAFAILCNIGEGVYVIIMPNDLEILDDSALIVDHHKYDEIKALLPTIWGLTGAQALFYLASTFSNFYFLPFLTSTTALHECCPHLYRIDHRNKQVYLLIVLISYLRLLKYKSAPKVGKDQNGDDDTESTTKITQPKSTSANTKQRSRKSSLNLNVDSESASSRISGQTTSDSGKRTPKSFGSITGSQSSISASNFRLNDNTYVNWPHFDDDSALGHSPTDDVKANDDEQSLPSSSVYDMPPGNVYDETPLYDSHQRPPPVTKPMQSREEKKGEKHTNSTLSSTDLVTIDMQEYANTPAPSEAGESTYSTPRSRPALDDTPSNRSKPSSEEFIGSEQKSLSKKPKEKKDDAQNIEPAVASSFFKKLTPEQNSENALEEMFRIFGGDLCSKHPENCERYLKSYKDVRSKTSHINSMRDPYEFERFGGLGSANNAQPQLQKFSLNNDPYSLNSSIYGSSTQFQSLPSRHQSHKTVKLEPEYSSRPSSRKISRYPDYSENSTSGHSLSYRTESTLPTTRSTLNSHFLNQSHPHHQLSRQNRLRQNHSYHDNSHPHSIYSSFSPGQSIYYDDACSTCYGAYGVYGDYSDYSFDSFYSPSKFQPPPVCAPTTRSANSKRSDFSSFTPPTPQFSVMSDLRRPSFKSDTPTWIPVRSEDEYSQYTTQNQYFRSNKSRSLPNINKPPPERLPSSANADISFSRPLGPEFTLPSPREVNKLSRSSSWSSSQRPSSRLPSSHSNMSSRPKSSLGHSSKNYNGYHTSDLRRHTSHTSYRGQGQDRSSSKSGNFSTASIRSNRPNLPPRRLSSNYFNDARSSSSFFGNSRGRASSQRRSSQSIPRNSSHSSFSNPMSSRTTSHQSGRSVDPYPDRHTATSTSSRLQSPGPSLDRRQHILRQSKLCDVEDNDPFRRSRSVRYSENADARSTSKQVKFGSTPDLRRT